MKCPICYSEKNIFLFTADDILYRMVEDKFKVLKCQYCSAVFISPFPTQQETEKFYPINYYSYDINDSDSFFENLKKKIIKSKMDGNQHMSFFDRLLVFVFKDKFSGIPLYRKENGKFLDIGCGNGKNLKLIEQYGWDTYGIELDVNAVAHARSQNLKVEKSSLEEASFKNIKFDSIRIWHVFEHLTNPHSAMRKIEGLLTFNGEILMALPNNKSLASIFFRRYWYGLDAPRHVISYSPRTLRYLTNKHRLKITEIKYASCGSFVGSISNFIRKKFGYSGNLVNNIFLIILFSPIDFISDFFKLGDIILLKIKKK